MSGVIRSSIPADDPDSDSIKYKDIKKDPQASLNEMIKRVCVDPTSAFNSAENIIFNGPDDTIKAAVARAKENPNRSSKGPFHPVMHFCQENSLGDSGLSPGSDLTVVAHTQSGKTLASWYQVYIMASVYGLLPIIFAMNRQSEPGRFMKDAETFNSLILAALDILGLSEAGIFFFNSVHEDGSTSMWKRNVGRKLKVHKDDQEEHDSHFKSYMDSIIGWTKRKMIPVVVTITNGSRFKKMKTVVIDAICKCGYYTVTSTGPRIKAFFLCDEADKLMTTNDIDKISFFSDSFTIVVDTVLGILRFSSLYDSAMSLMNVTATIQILAIVKRPSWRTILKPIEMEPSTNFMGFKKYEYQTYRTIERVTSISHKDMLNTMMSVLNLTQSAFIYVVSKLVQQEKCREAALIFSNLLSVAWEGGNVYMATCNSDYISLFENVELVNRAIENMFGLIENSLDKSQFNKVSKDRLVTFESCGQYITSYPSFMELFSKLVDMNQVHKTALFAGFMASRGTPIKSINHKFGLTHMFFDTLTMNSESLIQVLGRLCGIVPRDVYGNIVAHVKYLWAPASVHEIHEKSLEKTPILRYLIQMNIDVPEALRVMQAIIDHVEFGSPTSEIQAVLSALMIEGCDSRLAPMGKVHKKRKLIDYDPEFVTPDHKPFAEVTPCTECSEDLKYKGSMIVDDDECAKFVSEMTVCLEKMMGLIGDNKDTVDLYEGGRICVVSNRFLQFLKSTSLGGSKTILDLSKSTGNRVRHYIRVFVSPYTGTNDKQATVKLYGNVKNVKSSLLGSLKKFHTERARSAQLAQLGGHVEEIVDSDEEEEEEEGIPGSPLEQLRSIVAQGVISSASGVLLRTVLNQVLVSQHGDMCSQLKESWKWETLDEVEKKHKLRNFIVPRRLRSWGFDSSTIAGAFSIWKHEEEEY